MASRCILAREDGDVAMLSKSGEDLNSLSPKLLFISPTKLSFGYSDVSSHGRCHVLSGSCCHAVCLVQRRARAVMDQVEILLRIIKLKCDIGGRRDYEGDATYAVRGGVHYLQVSRRPAANMQLQRPMICYPMASGLTR